MATAPTTKSMTPLMTPIALDPTAQKLAELEGRIAALEGALNISSSGVVTLKSPSNIIIDAGMNVTLKAMATTTIQASGQMTVQASGTLTVKGSTINLN